MDNIENIIVFLFIIFSIFSSIMRKKKKLKSSKKSKAPVKKQGILNMLEEFNKAMTPPNPQTKSNQISEVDAFFLENKREAEKLAAIDNLEEIQAQKARKSYSNYKMPIKSASGYTLNDLAYDEAENELNNVNYQLHNIQKLLKNPKSLREYILMKEILDKPRAFQEF